MPLSKAKQREGHKLTRGALITQGNPHHYSSHARVQEEQLESSKSSSHARAHAYGQFSKLWSLFGHLKYEGAFFQEGSQKGPSFESSQPSTLNPKP